MTALGSALAGWSPPAVDADDLRPAAASLVAAQERLELAGERVRRVAAALQRRWRGDAAAAALDRLEDVAREADALAAVHAQAASLLRACAHAVDDAHATWQRARALEAQDAQERATARSLLVVPYEVDGSALRRAARAAAAASHEQAEQACAQAAAQLRDLARRPSAGLSAHDQLAGFGRGAADAVLGTVDLTRDLLRDPRGTATGMVNGLVHAAGHRDEAVAAVTGWDVLQQGRYGEWAGGFVPDLLTGVLSGGAVPAGRRAADVGRRLSDLEQRERGVPHRLPVPGGPVRPQPGARMTPRYPKVVRPLSAERQRHVLEGDPPPRTGGGHRFGAGRGKSEFPEGWTDELIVRRVMETATRPSSSRDQPHRPNVLAYAEHDGVCVQVAVSPKGKVVTGYPVTGEVAAAGCGRRAA